LTLPRLSTYTRFLKVKTYPDHQKKISIWKMFTIHLYVLKDMYLYTQNIDITKIYLAMSTKCLSNPEHVSIVVLYEKANIYFLSPLTPSWPPKTIKSSKAGVFVKVKNHGWMYFNYFDIYAPKLLDIFILVHIIINTSCKLDVNILICMNKTKYELRLDWFVSTDV